MEWRYKLIPDSTLGAVVLAGGVAAVLGQLLLIVQLARTDDAVVVVHDVISNSKT